MLFKVTYKMALKMTKIRGKMRAGWETITLLTTVEDMPVTLKFLHNQPNFIGIVEMKLY
jgi:hypothetical protein